MTQVKRARLSSIGHPAGSSVDVNSLHLNEKLVLDLPPDIGEAAAIAAWPSASPELHTNGSTQNGTTAIAIGTRLGCIALVHTDKTITILEGPGGPAIQNLLVLESAKHSASASAINESKPRAKAQYNVIAGDAEGRVTTYHSSRMFSRKTYSAPISALAPDYNPYTPSTFLVGDMGGIIISCHDQGAAWKAQVDASTPSSTLRSVLAGKERSILDFAVKDVCSVQLPDRHGLFTNYVLVAFGSGHVQLLSRGMPVHTIALSAPCNTLCPGVFFGGDMSNKMRLSSTGRNLQALLGDEKGRLFVLEGFELVPYAQLDYPITRVFSLPLQAFGPYDGSDLVVCATRSDTIYILYQKKIVATHVAGFWPAAVNVIPAFMDAGPAIAVVEGEMCGGHENHGRVHILLLELALEES
ncbi:hypothetical protein H4R24_002255 [Coemansia sp. RSA 988]|nr:hypothetical protein H4R24_002255 [Coemansia sp. RSA 988]